MAFKSFKPQNVFTVEQANATLPLVRAIVTDLVELARDVLDRRQRLDQLAWNRERAKTNVYSEELAQIEDDLEQDARKVQDYIDELQAIGVEPKSATEGLVDFPCRLDGRLVYLCWKLGEPEVQYWHEIDSGYAGRQSLVAEPAGYNNAV